MTATGPIHPKPSSRSYGTVAISTAADGLSDVISLGGLTLSAIQMSTAWTSADLAYYASIDGSTSNMALVYTSTGALHSHVVGADRVVTFDPAVFAGLEKVQLVSLTTGSTTVVAQAAERTIKLGLSEYVGAD